MEGVGGAEAAPGGGEKEAVTLIPSGTGFNSQANPNLSALPILALELPSRKSLVNA